MTPSIRPIQPIEFRSTEILTRDTFWDLYKPGADEHLALHQLRESTAYLPALDLGAFTEERLVGHCICTLAHLRQESAEQAVLCVGPISVEPEFQGQGIGSLLLRTSISIATELAYPALVLYGNPAYYSRFGFRPSRDFSITTSTGDSPDYFMVLPLTDSPLQPGSFHESPAFQVDPEELDRFEANFPAREKHVRPGQLDLP